jgi:hypothetical protein
MYARFIVSFPEYVQTSKFSYKESICQRKQLTCPRPVPFAIGALNQRLSETCRRVVSLFGMHSFLSLLAGETVDFLDGRQSFFLYHK